MTKTVDLNEFRTERFLIDPRESKQKRIPDCAPETLLDYIRKQSLGEIRYSGTPLGIAKSAGIEQQNGVKRIYVDIAVTNERNWPRFSFSPDIIASFANDEGGGEVMMGARLTLGITEKAVPFCVTTSAP
ncbi:hypothetical protein [Pseudomonas amygdali]|uniref:Uncharacterized protein n=2 Tax=Pseudomonas amygdali pv. lachrymans TaxID=53707 RepID=A0ABR5KQC6_PSEAV|nr:hypothetical protein [Pseudomonas amygdali]AXH59589.1 hypothetical protein PLA107_030655 [Pseudomonas amygdali pv. lachrymans str. M301315]KPC17015.1 Uncharacterized protein AC499_0217 [Pseudomonas amygdali pv. lachrymans]KPC17974.1 Uncharacterized protein AC499_1176 [Pseudomonas amygdali pv. lachrymans]RMT06156.1 hypothetical protein ALP54_03510 [Pseudomonas amygdali pv. lachrymans]